MTTFPSPPHPGATPGLPPLPAPGRGAPSDFPVLARLLNGFDPDPAPTTLSRGAPAPVDPARPLLETYIRSDGSTPLAAADAARLADSLSQAIRQPTAHPLQRELQQLPAESVRQVLDFVARYAPAGREVPSHMADALLQAARQGTEPRPPETRPMVDGSRQQAPAAAERGALALRDGVGGRDAVAMSARTAEDAGPRAAFPAATRTTGDPALPHPVMQRTRAETAPHSALHMAPAGTDPATPRTGSVPGAPLAPPPQAAPAPPGLPQELAVSQALNARAPAEAIALPGRADAAASAGDAIGLPGFAAIGITIAAVAQPAGTTFAHAPTTIPRTRMRKQAQGAGQARAGRAEDRASRGQQRGQARAGGDAPSDGEGRRRGSAPHADAAAPHAPRRAGGPPQPATAPTSRQAAPSGSPAPGGKDPDGRPLACAGITAETVRTMRARRGPGSLVPPADGSPPPAAALASTEAFTQTAGDAGPAGHSALGGSDEPKRRRGQKLYWSLIAVTYACLAMALATAAPDLTPLPVAAESLGAWRHALTGMGLVSGLWAWLLARRLR